MLLMLTFLACLTGAQAERCQTVEIAWEGPIASCGLMGQVEAAKWVNQHAGYRLKGGYRCLPGRAI